MISDYQILESDKKTIEQYLVECGKCGYIWLRRQPTPKSFAGSCPACRRKGRYQHPDVQYAIINGGERCSLVAIRKNGRTINIPQIVHNINQSELRAACPMTGGRKIKFGRGAQL